MVSPGDCRGQSPGDTTFIFGRLGLLDVAFRFFVRILEELLPPSLLHFDSATFPQLV